MRALILALALSWCGLVQAAQPFRVDVHLVQADFTVRDPNGNLVGGLTKDDFEVFEDGVRQTISFFSPSADLPLRLGLLVDASGSQEHFVKQHERDLKEFLKDVLSARDQAFLLGFGNHLRVVSDFSASRDDIVRALEDYEHGDSFPEIGPPEIRVEGTAFFDALYYSTTLKLAPVETGRRAIVVFSDGEDNSSARDLLDVIEAAQRNNVLVYGIRYSGIGRHGPTARNKYGIRVMARIAQDTGGAAFDARKSDLRRAFREIDESLRGAYELGYYSANTADDGAFRKLVIRAMRPGLTVRARAGYYAQATNGL
jgi:VWFA-related protein